MTSDRLSLLTFDFRVLTWNFVQLDAIMNRAKIVHFAGMTKTLKFIVEKHRDGYVAYPPGLKGVVVGEGSTSESVLADAQSAARFHIKSFGKEAFEEDEIMEAFIAEASNAGA